MAVPNHLAAEEEQLGRWPRRLLHVPSMTSFPWQPGNIYRNTVEPKYNILTYTWGRWRLRDTDEHASEVESLAIDGVPWDIPKIKPAHFTADKFLSVIRSITQPLSQEDLGVDFIWLDIACINQRDNEPDSAAEVGRQGDIFRGASTCFAWLTSVEETDLLQSVQSMQDALADLKVPAKFRTAKARDTDILDIIYGSLKTLLRDPWFSSLWTLQEAFLRRNIYLLSRRGRTALWEYNALRIFLDRLAGPLLATLERRLYEEPATDEAAARTLGLILDLATRTGLSTICGSNVIAPYIASSKRRASREEDRIYAIQQIFGFRLGSSSIGFSSCSYTLAQLKAQFATRLLEVYPCESQMFLHSKPAPVGTAWLPNSDSWVPFDIPNYQRFSSRMIQAATDRDKAEKPTCILGIDNLDGATWASFTGPTSPWSYFEKMFIRAEHDQSDQKLWLRICLDAAGDETTTTLQKSSHVVDCIDEEVPSSLSSSLTELGAVVLLLGHCEIPNDRSYHYAKSAAVGLLLKPYLRFETQGYYQRLGFCVWHLGFPREFDIPDDPGYLYSLEKPSATARWGVSSGLFG